MVGGQILAAMGSYADWLFVVVAASAQDRL
jgi:hypothetical protein